MHITKFYPLIVSYTSGDSYIFSILSLYFLNILCNNHFLFECYVSVSFGVLIIKTSNIVFSSSYSFARQWFYHWLSFPTWLRALEKLSPYSNYTWHYTLCVSSARFSSLIARSLFYCWMKIDCRLFVPQLKRLLLRQLLK